MKLLKTKHAGTDAQEVVIGGDPRYGAEPTHFRVRFPGGELELCRTPDDEYWVHVYVNTPEREGWDERAIMGRLSDIRFDHPEKHASDTAKELAAAVDLLPLEEMYHMAVRVGRRAPEGPAKLFGEVVRGWTVPKRGTISHLVIGGRLAEGSLARSTCGAKIDSYPLRDALPAGCRPCGTCQRHHEAHLGPVT